MKRIGWVIKKEELSKGKLKERLLEYLSSWTIANQYPFDFIEGDGSLKGGYMELSIKDGGEYYSTTIQSLLTRLSDFYEGYLKGLKDSPK